MRGSRPLIRAACGLLALALVAAALPACGGGDGSTSSGAVSSAATTAEGGGTGNEGGGGTEQANGSGDSGSAEAGGDGSGETGPPGGEAKSFVQPGADNSIPNFGREATSGEFREAEAALQKYLDAREAGDWRTVCSSLSDEALEKLEVVTRATQGKVKGCVEVIEALAGESAPAARENLLAGRHLAALRVEEETAFALFHGPQGTDYVIPMVKDQGEWKIVQLTPIPYPVGSKAPAP